MSEEEKKLDLEYLFEEIPAAIRQASDGVKQVSRLVRAMKDFAHPDQGEKTLADLNLAVENTVTVSRNEWKYVAEIELLLDPGLPKVPCLPGEINQVFLNLIVNAAHAIGSKNLDGQKGKILVETKNLVTIAEIRISDTGTGIAP